MFKIDKSSVVFIDSNKSAFVIRQWDPQNNRFDQEEDVSGPEPDEKTVAKPPEEAVSTEAPEPPAQQAEDKAQTAWEEGYRQGLEDASAKFEEYAEERRRELDAFMAETREFQEGIIQEMEEDILRLSFDIAEKIVNIKLQKDDILFVEIIKNAIERLNARDKFAVRLNDKQYEKYFRDGTEWLAQELQCTPFTAVRDPALNPNACILESDDGIIDAGVDNQIKMLLRALNREDSKKNEAL